MHLPVFQHTEIHHSRGQRCWSPII